MTNNKRLIAKIMDGDTVVMTADQNLLSVEFGALDRGGLTDVVDWGIFVNRGSFSFIDTKGFFNDETINTVGFLGYTVKFYLVDRNSQYLIATFSVKSAEMDDATREVTIECVSKLEELQRQNQDESYPRPFNEKTTVELLSECFSNFEIIDGDDRTGLYVTNIYCPYFPKESTWARLNKICQASMCRVFDNEDGKPVISGSFPAKTPIVVTPSNILKIANSGYVSVPNSSIIVTERTKYTGTDAYLPDIELYFVINYDEQGEIAFVSNSDGFTLKTEEDLSSEFIRINIQKKVNSQYKINLPIVYLAGTITNESYIDDPAGGLSYPGIAQSTYSRYIEIGYSSVSAFDPTEILIGSGESNIIALTKIADGVIRVTDVNMKVRGDHFRDTEATNRQNISDENRDILEISSNDLIQSRSTFTNDDGSTTPLGDYIVEEVAHRYGKGIECFEIECLFNDYYDVNNDKVFDRDDLSTHFNKYDVIIPYIKKGNDTVPLRKNTDGTPKRFRVIGISYSYDGLLKQKLQIQEDRYDIELTPSWV